MKKYFLSLVAIAAAMLFATSCQESLVEPQLAGPTTFSVQLPDQMGTKAYGDEDFTNATINTLYVEVYDSESKELFHKPDPIKVENGEAKFSLNLVQNQEYDIIFWAQKGDAYEIIDLRTIEMNADHHNVEKGAAFYAVLDNFKPVNGNQPVVLTRPFAQLNLGTRLGTSYGQAKLISSTIEVTGAATHFNTVGEACTTTTTFTYENEDQKCPYVTVLNVGGEDFAYVSMDYLAVPGTQSALIKVKATIVVEDKEGIQTTLVREIESVPVKKNYRTNIVGNLITSETDFSVSIDSDFAKDGDTPLPDNRYVVVTDVGAANQALARGETFIAINKIKDEDVIKLFNSTAKVFYLQIPEADATLKIEGNNAEEVYLHVQDNTAIDAVAKLIINTPNGTVTVTGPGVKLQSIEATTASNTLILDGIKVADLDVYQGNVVAQNVAIVDNLDVVEDNTNIEVIVVEDGSSVTVNSESADNVEQKTKLPDGVVLNEEGVYEISNATGLIWLSLSVDKGDTFAGKTVKLTADIDLSENNWNPIGDNRTDKAFSGTFDGQNHIITGAHITGDHCFNGAVYGSKEGWGLFSVVDGATIKKLKVDGATFGSYTVISGTIAAYANNTMFKEIAITNTKIAGYNWYTGGVVGWAAGECTFDGINLDNTVAVGTLWDSHGQNAGGIAGGVSESAKITIKDCNIACVLDVINDVTSNYKWYIYRVSGMIIGNTNTTETKYNEVVTATATNVTCENVTVMYGKWMNYHYCEGYWNRGWGRYESSEYVGGVDQNEPHNHADGEKHRVAIPFDQLFGGSSNGSGHYPVKGLAEFPGVTVKYPAEYTCPLCGERHNKVN